MIPIEQLKQWKPSEVYQQYVQQLLDENPLVMETVTEQRVVKGKKKGLKTRQVYTSGYWSRWCRKKNMSHYAVYTKRIVGNRHRVVEVINFTRWVKIMDAYFSKARECIIDGQALNMGNGIGCLQAMHIERNHENKHINWNETKKQPMVNNPDGSQSRERIIYFTDDTYIRIGWVRFRRLTNEQTYEFDPSSDERKNGKGFRDLFVTANQANPLLKLKYPFYPYLQTKAS